MNLVTDAIATVADATVRRVLAIAGARRSASRREPDPSPSLGESRWESLLPRRLPIGRRLPGPCTRRRWPRALWVGRRCASSRIGTAGTLLGPRRRHAHARRRALGGRASSRSSAPGLTIHRGSRLDRADRTMLGPIPITTPERTLIDLSARMEDDGIARNGRETRFRRRLVEARPLARRSAEHAAEVRASRQRDGSSNCSAIDRGPALESGLEVEGLAADPRSQDSRFRSDSCGSRFRRRPLPARLRVAEQSCGARVRRVGARTVAQSGLRARIAARLAEFASRRDGGYCPSPGTTCTREPARVERWLRTALADSLVTGRPQR